MLEPSITFTKLIHNTPGIWKIIEDVGQAPAIAVTSQENPNWKMILFITAEKDLKIWLWY